MDFRDFASKETSALIARLLAGQSDSSLQQLRQLRDALEAATRALEDSPSTEKDIQEFVARLNNAASTAVRSTAQRIREEARTAVDEMRATLEVERAAKEKLETSIADAEAELEVLHSELRKEKERAETSDHDLAAALEANKLFEATRLELEAACQDEARTRGTLENELRDVRGLLDRARSEAAELAAQLDAELGDNATLKAELAAARETVELLEAGRAELESLNTQETETRRGLEDALADARRQLDAALDEVAQLGGRLEAEAAESERLREDAAAAKDDRGQLEAARAEAEAVAARETEARIAAESDLDGARAERDAALAQAGQLSAQLETTAADTGNLLADLSAAREDLEGIETERNTIAARLQATTERVDALERDQASHEDTVLELEARLHVALESEAKLQELAAGDQQGRSEARAEADGLRAQLDGAIALMESAARSVDEIASATTVEQLLGTLVKELGTRFRRVALFGVKGNRLEGQHQFGLDQTADVTKLVIPLNLDSLLSRAVASGTLESLSGSELADGSGTPFGGTPTAGLAAPLILDGETLAVVYADDAGEGAGPVDPKAHESSAAFAWLLVRQTAVLLVRLNRELKTFTELRDYATLLLQEAERMYTADIAAGKSGDELRNRLKDTIDCARELYSQRAALESGPVAALLDDQIAATIDSQSATPFIQDLAAVVGRQIDSRRAAEAS